MQINSELPTELLCYNNEYNEYDFVLFHLMEHSIYKNYFIYQRILHPDRLMILDNSAYEYFIKGEQLDIQKFIEVINVLKPDYYILPDKLMDKEKTIEMVKSFDQSMCPYSSPIAIAQGNSENDLIDCLNIYKNMNIKYIGLPFHNSFFKNKSVHYDIQYIFYNKYKVITEDIRYAMGRVQFVQDNKELLDQFEKVHFLGSHCPLEKTFYNRYFTMDTGYPVKLGILNISLFNETEKPNIIIDDFMFESLNESQRCVILNNINKFKDI